MEDKRDDVQRVVEKDEHGDRTENCLAHKDKYNLKCELANVGSREDKGMNENAMKGAPCTCRVKFDGKIWNPGGGIDGETGEDEVKAGKAEDFATKKVDGGKMVVRENKDVKETEPTTTIPKENITMLLQDDMSRDTKMIQIAVP